MPKPSYICNCDVIHEDIVNDVKRLLTRDLSIFGRNNIF